MCTSHPARWLVVGHGSVGAELTARLQAQGRAVLVHDPAPRIPITAPSLSSLDVDDVDVVGICVGAAAAATVYARLAQVVRPETLVLDWNTDSPQAKATLADAMPARVVDVALLDAVRGSDGPMRVALSGPYAQAAAAELRTALSAQVAIVGPRCGLAAEVKLLRSLFMKSLEALTVEFLADLNGHPGRDVVLSSVGASLAAEPAAFLLEMARTNRLHADRRAAELATALDVLTPGCARVADVAVTVLRELSALWARPDAPPETADIATLAGFVHEFFDVLDPAVAGSSSDKCAHGSCS